MLFIIIINKILHKSVQPVLCRLHIYTIYNLYSTFASHLYREKIIGVTKRILEVLLYLKTKYVTLDHKTSHKGQFFEIEIYTSSESWINKLSIDVWLW